MGHWSMAWIIVEELGRFDRHFGGHSEGQDDTAADGGEPVGFADAQFFRWRTLEVEPRAWRRGRGSEGRGKERAEREYPNAIRMDHDPDPSKDVHQARR